MELDLEYNELKKYVSKQLYHFFPDEYFEFNYTYDKLFNEAICRTEYCYKYIKKFNKNGKTYFNHLNSDQYTMFIWFLSNTIWKETNNYIISNKLFYLNKILHGFSCMYDSDLPDIMYLYHCVGTVLGKAKYSNYFVAAHGCTVGANHGKYPIIGERVAMFPNSSIIGDCKVESNVSVGINATIFEKNIKRNTVIFVDNDGKTLLKQKQKSWTENIFY